MICYGEISSFCECKSVCMCTLDQCDGGGGVTSLSVFWMSLEGAGLQPRRLKLPCGVPRMNQVSPQTKIKHNHN